MEDMPPDVSFPETWKGYEGQLRCGDEIVSEVAHFAIRGTKYQAEKDWSLRMSVRGDPNTVGMAIDSCEAANLHFNGTTYSGQAVRADLLDVSPPAIPVEEPPPELDYTASATQVDVDLQPLPDAPTKQRIAVLFTDHALTRPEKRFLVPRSTGEITPLANDIEEEDRRDRPDPEPLFWPTRFGRGALWSRYSWQTAQVGANKAKVRVPVSRLELEVPAEYRKADVASLVDEVREDVQWLLRLLTLFSRQHVRCVEISVVSTWGEDGPGQTQTSRRLWSSTPSDRHQVLDPVLMHPMAVPDEGLEDLWRKIDGLSYSDAVSSAIGFLVEAFRAEYLEGQWAAAFTALETMVNAIGDAHGFTSPIEGGEFYRLKAKLEATIDDYQPKEDKLADTSRGHLKRMLGALSRAPFAARAARVVEHAEIDWEDLWPSGTELENAIGAAYGRRSNLVHTGQIPEDRNWFVDQFRMHALAERLVLAALQVPDDWITLSPYRHCGGLSEYPT